MSQVQVRRYLSCISAKTGELKFMCIRKLKKYFYPRPHCQKYHKWTRNSCWMNKWISRRGEYLTHLNHIYFIQLNGAKAWDIETNQLVLLIIIISSVITTYYSYLCWLTYCLLPPHQYQFIVPHPHPQQKNLLPWGIESIWLRKTL